MIYNESETEKEETHYDDINCLKIYHNQNIYGPSYNSRSHSYSNLIKINADLDDDSEHLQKQNKFGLKLKTGLSLMPHQIDVIDWMKEIESRSNPYGVKGGVISLEMGLGKSLISLSYILSPQNLSLFNDFGISRGSQNFNSKHPSLVLCPKNIIVTTWKNQIEQFFGPNQHKFLLIEKEEDVSCLFNYNNLLEYKIIIITYSRLIAFAKSVGAIKIISLPKKSNNSENKFKIQYILNEEFMKSKSDIDIKFLIGMKNLLFNFTWENIICDESHNFRNIKSLLFKCLQLLKGKYKWCFTGTPIVNYYNDLISQFVFLGLTPEYREKNQFEIYYPILSNYVNHKTYTDCNIVLPPVEYKQQVVKLSYEEREFYNLYFKYARDNYKFLIKNDQFEHIFSIIMRLRQICISSYLILIKDQENNKEKPKYLIENDKTLIGKENIFHSNTFDMFFDINSSIMYECPNLNSETLNLNQYKSMNKIDEQIKSSINSNSNMSNWLNSVDSSAGYNSSKIKQVIDIVKNKVPKTEKILIFSMFKSVTELFFHAFEFNCPEINYLLFNGDQSLDERNYTINLFKEDPTYRVLFITYQTGSEGLNIFQANNVILLEGWWNFSVENQAIARCHRLGQQNKVFVWKLIVEDSIEERMQAICLRKQEDFDLFIKRNVKKDVFCRDKYVRALLCDKSELESLLNEI